MTFRFEYFPALDRFAVCGGVRRGLGMLTETPGYASLEYLRYVPIADVSLDDVDATLARAPREVCCAITTGCNLMCRVCIADATAHSPGHIPADDLRRTVTSLSEQVRRVTITGGEPTLHPDLPELMECCSEAGKHVVLSTNGYDVQRISLALEHVEEAVLAVSVHGTPALHDRYVGMPGSHERALATIAAARAAGHLVHVLSIATAETLPTLRELALSLAGCDIVEHRINLVKPSGRIDGNGVSFEQVEQAMAGLQLPHKLSVKRRDQPQLFLDHTSTLEVRRGRQY